MGTLVGTDWGSRVGPDRAVGALASSAVVYAMAALNIGWAGRFKAQNTKDIHSVRLSWSTVTSPGVVQLRIETIDTTTGKPTGTLYDTNATYDITPAAGDQTYTFATPPTTGLTVGNEYAIVLLTTTGGTTQTLRSYTAPTLPARYSVIALQAADGTTRTNFAEVAASIPICSLVDEDNNENPCGFIPYAQVANNNLYGNDVPANNLVAALKITTAITVVAAGIELDYLVKVGTPVGDLRCRIYDNSNNVVSGASVTIDKDSLSTGASARGCFFLFPSPVTLTAGTYRLAIDSLSSANSSNCWRLVSVKFLDSAANPANFILSTSSDDGATWADSTTDVAPMALLVDSFPAPTGGSGGGPLVGGRLAR